MAVEASLPQIGTVLLAAAIDSINPCAIGVLILLVSTLLATAKSRSRVLKVGVVYIAAIYITYFLAGLGLMFFFRTLPIVIAQYITMAVATVVIGMGLVEIKDYFWYGRGFSLAISPEMAKRINERVQNITAPGIIALGAFVAAVELPCTGGPYLAIITLLSRSFDFGALLLMVLYNLVFVLPLIVILGMIYFGATKVQTVKRWKQENRAYMRLAIGILLVYLGWVLIFIASGVINFE